MSDHPKIQAVTQENQERFAQQSNTASIPLTVNDILALRKLLKMTEKADTSTQNQDGGDGGPPRDSGMEARVAALEDQAKKTFDSLHRMEVTLAGLAPVLATLPTKADMATSAGALNTLAATVSGMDKRLGSAETAITNTIQSAVGKAIGPWQLPVIIVGTGGALAVLVTGYHWLIAQSWFPH